MRNLGAAGISAPEGLPKELSLSGAVFPGIDLRLVFELPENAAIPVIGVA